MNIHPTAIISKKAELGSDVTVGPYSIIADNVIVGSNTKIGAFCVVEGHTFLGKNCQVFTGAVIGSKPQDLKYKDERSSLEIGDNNIIREYCTMNPGTGEAGKTIVGSDNLFMAYSHIAHDCRVGNGCVFANNGTLAGHVTVEDKAVIGGLVAIHQFVRVGKLAIIGGLSKVIQDIPPYSTCDGHPARVYGLNLIGLRRSNFTKEAITQLNKAFKILFHSQLSLKSAIGELEVEISQNKEIDYLIQFIKGSQRGITHSFRSKEK